MLLVEIIATLSNVDDQFCGLANLKKKNVVYYHQSQWLFLVVMCVCKCGSVLSNTKNVLRGDGSGN